jgi:hypothetical protein
LKNKGLGAAAGDALSLPNCAKKLGQKQRIPPLIPFSHPDVERKRSGGHPFSQRIVLWVS